MSPSSHRRVTLQEVARLAGVSHMTVARVVQGKQNVAASTREKVRQAIEELHYRPDPALSALAAYRTRRNGRRQESTLAFLDCDNNAFSRLVREGAQAEAARLGYTLESFPMPAAQAARRQLGRMLFHRGIRGLLFGPSDFSQTFAGWDWSHFATVSLGALTHQPAMNAVTMDYFECASRAFDLLRSAGCRRIGFAVSTPLENRTGHRWVGGYAAQAGIHARIYSRPSFPPKSLGQWAARHRIDGLLTIHRQVWRTLAHRGIRIVFLNEFECPAGQPHFVYDAGRIGREGARLVHLQLLNHQFDLPAQIKTVTLQAFLANGEALSEEKGLLLR